MSQDGVPVLPVFWQPRIDPVFDADIQIINTGWNTGSVQAESVNSLRLVKRYLQIFNEVILPHFQSVPRVTAGFGRPSSHCPPFSALLQRRHGMMVRHGENSIDALRHRTQNAARAESCASSVRSEADSADNPAITLHCLRATLQELKAEWTKAVTSEA